MHLAILSALPDPMDEVLRHTLFKLGPMDFTNQAFMAVIAGALMILILPAIFHRVDDSAPRGARNFFESIMEYLRLEVFRPALKEHTDRFVPFLWTMFFFILFCNLLGQIPVPEIYTLFTGKEFHYWGTATGSLTTTGGLAILAFIAIHINGVMQVARSLIDGTYGHHGHHEEHSSDGAPGHEAAVDLEHARSEALPADVTNDFKALGNPTAHYADDQQASHRHSGPDNGHLHGNGAHGNQMNPLVAWVLAIPIYLWNFAPHPFKPGPGGNPIMWVADVPMWLFLLALELIGAVVKPFALMIRLFANMIAGHLVLGALVLLIPLSGTFLHQAWPAGFLTTLLSLMIRVLELFVAFLQAYIFTFLTTLFIASAVAPEH